MASRFARLCISLAAALTALCTDAQEDIPDPREREIESLRQQAIALPPSDSERRREIEDERIERYFSLHREKAAALHEKWKEQTDLAEKSRLGEALVTEAIHSHQPNLVTEVSTGGIYPSLEVSLPDSAATVRAEAIGLLHLVSEKYSPQRPALVIRRMTNDRLEVWMPDHGWLFNRRGYLISQARVPRRDGCGREWYGAFLPNGSWVTTDLWESDQTLTFFSRSGRWKNEIKAEELVPRTNEEDSFRIPLIGWCRCDRRGQGFVLSVGSEGGWGRASVTSAGKHRLLQDANAPWTLCYPRDLEPKGSIPSDDGKLTLLRQEASHGEFVGYPVFSWDDCSLRQVEGYYSYGFWPGSHEIYIGSGTWDALDPAPGLEETRRAEEKTWFYHPSALFSGWINAGRIGDDAQGAMLFRDAQDRVITVDQELKVKRVERFADGRDVTLRPLKIFKDLHLGFFIRGRELMIARWNVP